MLLAISALSTEIHTTKTAESFAYIQNTTVSGMSKGDQVKNLPNFLNAAKYGLVIGDKALGLLGHYAYGGWRKSDPKRLGPLRGLPLNEDLKSQQRVLGLF